MPKQQQCTACSNPLAEDATVCNRCGVAVKGAEPEPAAAPPPPSNNELNDEELESAEAGTTGGKKKPPRKRGR